MQKLINVVFRLKPFCYLSFKKTRVFLYTRARVIGIVLITFTLATAFAFGYLVNNSHQTFAAATDTINFQSRLENSNGAIVPDGDYNVEFKLYTVSSGGTALWTEDYLNSASQGVVVSNGYLTVNLGSVNPFSSATIPWSQQLYLGINIGGTTNSPTWDGEMNPRLLLTAVPYAFQSQYATELQTTSGSNTATLSFTTPTATDSITLPNASGTVCLDNSVACGFASSSGSGNYIQNSTLLQSSANINIQSSSIGSATEVLQALTSQTADLLTFENSTATAALSGVNSSGQLYYQSGSYTGTLAESSLTANATYTLPNATGTICLDNSSACGFAVTSGSGSYIQNETTLQTSANFAIQSASTSSITAVIEKLTSQSADLLDIDNSVGGVLVGVSAAGLLTGTNGISISAGGAAIVGTTTINSTGSSSTTIGNSGAPVTINGNSSSSIGFANFNVATSGLVTLLGGLAPDITTSTASTANTIGIQPGISSSNTGGTSGATLTLQGGNDSGSPASGSVTGGNLSLLGGNATGASGTRNGGSVSIDAGTGASANGNINIGTTNSATTTLGRSGGTTTINGNSSSTITFGNFSVASSGLITGNNGLTVSNTVQGGSFSNASSNPSFQVNTISGNGTVSIGNSSTVGNLLLYNSTTTDPVTIQEAASPTIAATVTIPDTTGTVCLSTTSSTTCSPSSGSGFYIQNNTALQTNANFDIQSLATGSITAILKDLTSQTADLLDLDNSSGNPLLTVASNGLLTLLGGLSPDITTAGSSSSVNGIGVQPGTLSAGGTGTNTGATLTLQGGNESGTPSTGNTVNGGTLSLLGGNATGSSGTGTRAGGNVSINAGNASGSTGTADGGNITIDAGTGNTSNGTISIGTSNATGITIGQTGSSPSETTTIDGNSSSSISFGGNINITGAGAITAAGTIQGATINGTSSIELNGTSINTAGTLSNVAYLNAGSQTFTGNNTFSATSSAVALSGIPTASGTASLLDLGNAISGGSANGTYIGENAVSTFTGNLIALQKNNSTEFAVSSTGTVDANAYFIGANNINTAGTLSNVAYLNATTQTFTGANTFNSAIVAPTSSNTINGLVINSGALSSVTGYAQSSGNFLQSGSGTFGTGSGSVSLNGGTTVTGSNTLTVATANGLILGTASSHTGGIVFDGSGGAGTLTLVGPTTPNTGNFTLTIPTITANDTICTNGTLATSCSNYAPATGGSGYVQLAPASVQADSSTNNSVFINKTGSTGNIIELQKSGSDVFDVGNAGLLTLAGGLAPDITTATASTAHTIGIQPGVSSAATGTGATLTLQGGNESGTTTAVGGTLSLLGGNATGASGTRTGGNITIDAGTGSTATSNGTISIGANNATGVTIGQTAGSEDTTINGDSSSSINLGSGTTASFTVASTTGVTTLQGGNAIDLTSPSISTNGTTAVNSLTLQPGTNNYCSISGSGGSGSCTLIGPPLGANLDLYSGDVTGRYRPTTGSAYVNGIPGNVNIDTGTAASGSYVFGSGGTGGDINIGTNYASQINIGNTSMTGNLTEYGSTITIQGNTGGVNIGSSSSTYLNVVSSGTALNASNSAGILSLFGSGGTEVGTYNNSSYLLITSTNSVASLTVQNSDSINIGANVTNTSNIPVNIDTSGSNTIGNVVTIGSTAVAGDEVILKGGSTGGISIQAAAGATISLGTAAGDTEVIGDNGTTGSLVELQGAAITASASGGGGIEVGYGEGGSSTNLIPLFLSSYSTFSDTANTCTASFDDSGAIYYNSNTNTVRACINSSWQDIVSTQDFALQLFGVVPNSGTDPGDLIGATAATTNAGNTGGPCKVNEDGTSSVYVNSCLAYSGGRLVSVSATAVSVSSLVANDYTNLCLNSSGTPALLSSTGASTMAGARFNNLTATNSTTMGQPLLCLAMIKGGASTGTVADIYDARTFTTTNKTYATDTTSSDAFLGAVMSPSATSGAVVSSSSATGVVQGVVVAYTGSAASAGPPLGSPNVILAVSGPQWVTASSGALNNFVTPSTTAGVATAATTTGADAYDMLGVNLSTFATSCSTTSQSYGLTDCNASDFVYLNIQ